MKGNGYEARQTSKEETKMPRFMLEGPRQCTIFVLRSYNMHELRDGLAPQYGVNNYFVLCTDKAKNANKNLHKKLCRAP